MAAHSSILAREIPWTEEPSPGVTESRTHEELSRAHNKAQTLHVQRTRVCSPAHAQLRVNVLSGPDELNFN